ncbi:MAG: carbohydrate binding domain-containing protein, partial [bacterium]|nr:carbohydrate binding domain-containing protein [bacterium]
MMRKIVLWIFLLLVLIFFHSGRLIALTAADFEDNSVTYAGGTGSGGTRFIASNSSLRSRNGSRSFLLNYKITNTAARWLWCRGTFSAAQDWRNFTTVRFWLKGDGSQNLFSFKFTASGREYAHLGAEVISLVNTNWQKVEIPLGQCRSNGSGNPPPQSYLASVSDFVISLNGSSTNVYYDFFIDGLEILDPRPQVLNFDNANMEIYYINPGVGGNIISVSNNATVFQEGTGSLKLTYSPLVSWAYAEVSMYTQDWSTNSGVSFYLRGDGNVNTTFTFEIEASGTLFNRNSIPLSGTSWKKITLRFSDLSSAGPAPTPNDLKKVSLIRFVLNESLGSTTGILYLDDLRLLARADPGVIDDYENLFASYTVYGNAGVISCSNLPNDFHEGA